MASWKALPELGRFAFLTLPNYSMIALTNALEACRMANYVSGIDSYTWDVVTLDGVPAIASNGLGLHPTVALKDAAYDIVLVCGGIDVREATGRALKAALRRLARSGVTLGALCTGTFALAEAGLLDGYGCAIHWENLAAVREEFPELTLVDRLFVIDRNRITCTGGVAPLDMMLALIEARLGSTIAAKVGDEFIMARGRRSTDRQPPTRLAGRHKVLDTVVEVMASHIEVPVPVHMLAEAAGVSPRQLERLFQHHVGERPLAFYMGMRLDRARELLRQSTLSVTEIGVACGFRSPPQFSTAYRREFGHAPRDERKRARDS